MQASLISREVRKAVLVFFVCFSFSKCVIGQKVYSFKWNVSVKKPLIYTTYMSEIDTSDSYENNQDYSAIWKLFNTAKESEEAIKVLRDANRLIRDEPIKISLSNLSKEIQVLGVKNKLIIPKAKLNDTSGIKTEAAIEEKVVLRGVIDKFGTIKSFYLRSDQKNLLALMFQLPDKPVQVGSKWPLDINLIGVDENFKCDSSNKINEVKFLSVQKKGNEIIALIRYKIKEYISGFYAIDDTKRKSIRTTMSIGFEGVAKFSITKGRWVSYDGIMTTYTTGIRFTSSTKKFSLIPLAN